MYFSDASGPCSPKQLCVLPQFSPNVTAEKAHGWREAFGACTPKHRSRVLHCMADFNTTMGSSPDSPSSDPRFGPKEIGILAAVVVLLLLAITAVTLIILHVRNKR
jgi:hypothetical protein